MGFQVSRAWRRGFRRGASKRGRPRAKAGSRAFLFSGFFVDVGENTGDRLRHGLIKRNAQLGLRFDGTDVVMWSKLTWGDGDASDLLHCHFVSWVGDQGYRRVSIRRHVRQMANFAGWAEFVGFGTAPLDRGALTQLHDYPRVDPMEEIKTVDGMTQLRLKRGRFTVSDKMIASLKTR